MKAITILQPMASLLACNRKHYETRNWYIQPGEKFAIHAGKSTRGMRNLSSFFTGMDNLPLGVVIGIATINKVWKIHRPDVQTCIFEDIETGEKKDIFNEINPYDLYTCELCDNWYAMEITAEPIKPVPAKGQLGIWEWDPK